MPQGQPLAYHLGNPALQKVVFRNRATLVNSSHERGGSLRCETGYAISSCYQHFSDFRPCRVLQPDYNDSRRISPDRVKLRGAISDVLVFGYRQPALASNERDPILIWSIWRKMVVMYFNRNPFRTKSFRDYMLSEIAIEKQRRFRLRLGVRIGLLLRCPLPCAHSPSPGLKLIRRPCSVRR